MASAQSLLPNSSGVDLLGDIPLGPFADAGAKTDDVGAPPIIRLLVDDESSAVDLGSEPLINLPFLAAEDSGVGFGQAIERGADVPEPGQDSDSGFVDLLAASSEFELKLRSSRRYTLDRLDPERSPWSFAGLGQLKSSLLSVLTGAIVTFVSLNVGSSKETPESIFVREVARRLEAARLAPPHAGPDELLTGLDRALAGRPVPTNSPSGK